MKTVERGALVVAIALCLLGALSMPARAEDNEKMQCIEASDEGQDLRDANSYSLAQKAFVRCARKSCPEPIQRDCTDWLSEVNARFPSVRMVAKDETGSEVKALTVIVDGQSLAESVSNDLLAVDPGTHVLRIQSQGKFPVEVRISINPGEKAREIFVRLTSQEKSSGNALPAPHPQAASPSPQPAPTPALAPPAAAAPSSNALHVLGWELGALAVGAFASDAYFGISGAAERSADLSPGGCAPRCSAAEVQSVHTKFLVADVSLGVGIAATGGALYLLLPHLLSGAPSSSARLSIGPQAGGLGATFRTEFQ